jgi:hypothetical protein
VCAELAEVLCAAGWRVVCSTPSLVEAIPLLDNPLVDAIVCDAVTLGKDIQMTLCLPAMPGRTIIVRSTLPSAAEPAACEELGAATALHTGRPPADLHYVLEAAVYAAQAAAAPSTPDVRHLQGLAVMDQLGPTALAALPNDHGRQWGLLQLAYAQLADSRSHIASSHSTHAGAMAALHRTSVA